MRETETRVGRSTPPIPPTAADRLRSLQRQYADTSYAASLAERTWRYVAGSEATSRTEVRGARDRFEMLRARQSKLGLLINRLETRLAS